MPFDTTTQPAVEVSMAVEIVMAYVSHNSVAPHNLPALIGEVHAAVVALSASPAEPEADYRASASEIRKSITPDHLVSFIDGKPYKSLKRHLTANGHTPETYRQKYGLAADYPLVAASYAAARSELAKSIGLGQIRRDRKLKAA